MLLSLSLLSAPMAAEPVELAALELTFGAQCNKRTDSGPASLEALRTAVEAAGVELLFAEPGDACEACGCPAGVWRVRVEAAQQEGIRAAFPRAGVRGTAVLQATPVQLSIGRQCQPPAPGAPTSAAAVLQSMQGAGVGVLGMVEQPTCRACGVCPALAVALYVAPPDVGQVQELAGGWQVGAVPDCKIPAAPGH